MSDYKNIEEFDLMMKSILDEAQEAVPERVWEGVSSGLDKAARRKTVVLWFRRAAAGVAAAAVVALGVFFSYNTSDEFVPQTEGDGMIAVVEPEKSEEDGNDAVLMAEVEDVPEIKSHRVPGSAAEAIEISEEVTEEVPVEVENIEDEPVATSDKPALKEEKKVEEAVYFPEDWGKDEKKRKTNVKFTLSGIAGTNNALSQSKFDPLKRPEASVIPKETGIEETSEKSSYGIPLSFGAGIKFDISPRWSIGTGLNYTYLTRQFYGKYTKVDDNGRIEKSISSDIRDRQHYIGIPLNVFYNVVNNDKINFYAYAGGTVEKCLSNKYSVLNTSYTHTKKVEGVQLSANAGIGVEFMVGRHLGLYLDPSLRYYFENDRQPKSIRTVQPLMFGFEMGLRVRL